MLRLIALLLPLSLDTFAAAAAVGVLNLRASQRWRLGLILASFEGAMPLIGVGVGLAFGPVIGPLAEYVASAALIGLGAYLVLSNDDERDAAALFSQAHGFGLIAIGVGVSLDELAIGFGVGLLGLPVVWAIVLLACQAFVAAQLGLQFGARVGERLRERAERVAGVALVILGLVFLAQALRLLA